MWLVSANVLAASRFAASPLIETVNALGVLATQEPPALGAGLAGPARPGVPRTEVKADPFGADAGGERAVRQVAAC